MTVQERMAKARNAKKVKTTKDVEVYETNFSQPFLELTASDARKLTNKHVVLNNNIWGNIREAAEEGKSTYILDVFNMSVKTIEAVIKMLQDNGFITEYNAEKNTLKVSW